MRFTSDHKLCTYTNMKRSKNNDRTSSNDFRSLNDNVEPNSTELFATKMYKESKKRRMVVTTFEDEDNVAMGLELQVYNVQSTKANVLGNVLRDRQVWFQT